MSNSWRWFGTALQLRGSVAPLIWLRVLLFGTFGTAVAVLDHFEIIGSFPVLDSVADSVVCNLVLGLLLVFRTNTAYDKFWEGRKIWGTLVINIRNLAREIHIGLPSSDPDKAQVLKFLVAFAIATKLYLRQEPIDASIEALVNSSQAARLRSVKHPPLEITLWIGSYLEQQYQQQIIDSTRLSTLTNALNNLIAGLTGCERILKTPTPMAYSIYLKRLILIYCLSLPFHFVETLGLWTGLLMLIVSFILLGVEEIANEIESPFGHDPNDLLLDDICHGILDNVETIAAFGSLPVVDFSDPNLESMAEVCL